MNTSENQPSLCLGEQSGGVWSAALLWKPLFFKSPFMFSLLLIVICAPKISFGQGCSDAGFCTMGAMRPNQDYKKGKVVKLRSVELNHYVGLTRFNDVLMATSIDFNAGIGNRWGLQVKLPYAYASGVLATRHGIGDLSLSATFLAVDKKKAKLSVSVATKIPSNNSDLEKDGKPLPMYYQTSLGTYDAIAGASFMTKKWLLATGVQVALNRNGNKFLWPPWLSAGGVPREDIVQYPGSNELQRGVDVMFRVERNFRFSRFNCSLGLLPIYRLNEDEITKKGVREKVANSDGLALTGIVACGYRFSVHSGIKVVLGRRIVQREFNPDGLSREFVTSVGYEVKF